VAIPQVSVVLYAADFSQFLQTTADASGKSEFNVEPGKTYYISTHVAGTSDVIVNADAAYMALGTFSSQQEIDDSAYQGADTKVGDTRYRDVNGDGLISNEDKLLKVTEPAGGGTTEVKIVMLVNNL
jgi:hypothetical protein